MAKTIDISMDSFKKAYEDASGWIINFFETADLYELLAAGAIGLGFILFIVGLILL